MISTPALPHAAARAPGHRKTGNNNDTYYNRPKHKITNYPTALSRANGAVLRQLRKRIGLTLYEYT